MCQCPAPVIDAVTDSSHESYRQSIPIGDPRPPVTVTETKRSNANL